MTKKRRKSVNDIIKPIAIQSEKELNQLIQQAFDHPNLLRLSHSKLIKHSKFIKRLKQSNDLVAQQLNIPTKDDIANIAKLVQQIEDKLDSLEHKLTILTKDKSRKKRD